MSADRPASRPFFLPVLSRHLVEQFLRTFLLTLLALVAIYLLADFFDHFDTFLRHDAPAAAVLRYFFFKLPLVLTQVTPFAVLLGSLVGLTLLARQNEFVAQRACGVSIWQMAVPLLVLGTLIGVAVFVWNETIVPYSARRCHEIENMEIRKRGQTSVFAGRHIWYHGAAGFYDIDRVNMRRKTLLGLVVYQLGPNFRPERLIEADSAAWDGHRWQLAGARTREFTPEGVREVAGVPDGFVLPETLDDFRIMDVDAEDFSYAMLRQQIEDLRRKGVDASESWVDLHLKIALPAASFIMMLLAVPLAARGTRLSGLTDLVLGAGVGFAYFVVMAFSRSLGQTGALPPLVAAWTANSVFALIGGYYLLGSD